MSSSEEDISESEKSCEGSSLPTKNADRKKKLSSSESADSDESKITPLAKGNDKTIVAAHSSEESEECASDSSAVNQKPHSPSASESSSSDDESVSYVKALSTPEASSDEESEKSASVPSKSPANQHNGFTNSENETDSSLDSSHTLEKKQVKKNISSDDEFSVLESTTSKTFLKQNKSSISGDESDSSADSSFKWEKQGSNKGNTSSKSSSENSSEDSEEETASFKRSDSIPQKEIEEEATSNSDKSGGSNCGTGVEARMGKSSAEEDDPDSTVLQPSFQGNIFSFSNENLISYSSGILSLEKLSDKNDFWLIHCPKTITDEDLNGAKIDFTNDARLKIGGHKLQTSMYSEKGAVACVLPSDKQKQYLVVGLPVKGSIVFEESLKLPKPAPPMTSEDGVIFPEKLKERHPLFGADYKDRLRKISESQLLLKSTKKKKLKGKERVWNGNESVVSSVDLTKVKVEKTDKKQKTNRDAINKNHCVKEEFFSEKVDIINGEAKKNESKKRKREKMGDDSGLNKSAESSKTKKIKVDKSDINNTPTVERTPKKSDPEHSFLKLIENIKEEVLSSSELSFDENKQKKKKKRKSKGEM